MAEGTDRYPDGVDLRRLVRRALRPPSSHREGSSAGVGRKTDRSDPADPQLSDHSPEASAGDRGPSGTELRDTVESEPRVEFSETCYGFACHVAHVDGPGGTSFLAIDVDRRTPEVYFDAAAARGRDPISNSRECCSPAHVIDDVLLNPAATRRYLSSRSPSSLRADGGAVQRNGDGPGGTGGDDLTEANPSESPWTERLRRAYYSRCQYLHGDADRARVGAESTRLDEFRRPALHNDRLGQQYGWRMSVTPADRWPDLPLELVIRASHRQVVEALTSG